MIKTLCAIACGVIIGSINGNVWAFQFEHLEWSDTLPQVQREIERRKNHIVAMRNDTLVYYDKVFNAPCTVSLFFHSQTKQLQKVLVRWEDTRIGAKLYKDFTAQHGSPYQVDPYAKQFIWKL